MSKPQSKNNATDADPTSTDNQTQHGEWTPEVSEKADRLMQETSDDASPLDSTTEKVDKSELSLPRERRPIDH